MARAETANQAAAAACLEATTAIPWTPVTDTTERVVMNDAASLLRDPKFLLGVANTDALLYDDEWQAVLKSHPKNFRLDYALSREQTNVDGGKMYIQDKVKEYADEVFERMDAGAHMYFCGLKGMMPGITEMLEGVSAKKGLVWEDKLKEWKKAGQWHVEVY